MTDKERNAEDTKLQFIFNDTLVNNHFEEILDIIGKKKKSNKQVVKDRDLVLSLLNETFVNLTVDKLANSFNFILYGGLDENILKNSDYNEVNRSINLFSNYILRINDQFKDHGYTLLLSFFFWLTKDFK